MRLNDFICDHCGRFCGGIEINGIPVPVVVQIVAGVSPDYPRPFAPSAVGVQLPEALRVLLEQPTSRYELCVPCFAMVYGLLLEEAPQPEAKAAFEILGEPPMPSGDPATLGRTVEETGTDLVDAAAGESGDMPLGPE